MAQHYSTFERSVTSTRRRGASRLRRLGGLLRRNHAFKFGNLVFEKTDVGLLLAHFLAQSSQLFFGCDPKQPVEQLEQQHGAAALAWPIPRRRYRRLIRTNCSTRAKRATRVARTMRSERRKETNGSRMMAMSIQCSLQYFSFLSATENITMNSAAKANQMTPRLRCSDELQPAMREHLLPHAEFNQQHRQNGQRDEDHRHAEQPLQPARAGPDWPSASEVPATRSCQSISGLRAQGAAAGRGRRAGGPRALRQQGWPAVADEVLKDELQHEHDPQRLPGT